MRRFARLLADRRGIALAEYGLIAAIVGAAIAVGSLALGSAVTSAIHDDACRSQQTC